MLFSFCFRPNDVPRASEMMLFGDLPDSFDFSHNQTRLGCVEPYWDNAEIVHRAGKMARRRMVRGLVCGMADAIEWLSAVPLGNEDELIEFWSVATKLGIDLLARGRLQPAISDDGFDIWQMGPFDGTDWDRLHQLAEAMPPECHAFPSGESPLRVRTPIAVIRDYWNAMADSLSRTPAASWTVHAPIFASMEKSPAGQLRAWLADTNATSVASIRFGLRLESPVAAGDFSLVPYVQSTTDHSLSIDAEHIWDADAAVLARLGDDVEEVLLRSLRRASQVWPPLGKIMDQSRPDRLTLAEAEVDEFLETGTELLRANGFEISWPMEFVSARLEMRATIATAAPSSAKVTTFGLKDALQLRWEVALGDDASGAEKITDEELTQLANAKRPLLLLRGKWVIVDHDTLERIRKRKAQKPRGLRAGEALAAAMSGSLVVDGESIKVEADSVLANIAQRLSSYERDVELAEPAGLDATLRPYQRRGLAWLNEMCELGLGGCLADDMGLGKTIQIIALHLYRHNNGTGGPMLVVCPTSLLGNWERELAKFAPSINVKRFHGTDRDLGGIDKTDVALVTYGVVRRDRESLSEIAWDLVVADEAQHTKNPLSQTAKALRSIPSNIRLALTGTPVENQLSELWSLLDWTTPGLLGSLEAFRRNVATPIERFHDEDATAALSKVVRPFLLRRRKIDPDIAPELPRKTETDVFVPMTIEQVSLYKAVTDEALDAISKKTGMERRGLILKLLTSLKQICNHPAQFLKQSGPLDARSGKLAAFDEILEGLEGTDESVLVFSQYVQMGRLLEAHLASQGKSSLFLNGSIGPRKRDEMVEQFQSGKSRVFLLSLKAGGTGLNLTRATHVIHYDRWWNPAVEDQATDRAYRIGQTQPVQVHRMICEGTLEERIAQMLTEKRQLSESVIGAGEAWVSELGDDELASLVAFEDMS